MNSCLLLNMVHCYFAIDGSGDQDSVVPLLGSRTLVRELAHDLNLEITLPYGAWFHKGQVMDDASVYCCKVLSNGLREKGLEKLLVIQVGGWATEYGKLLTFATVRGAAHMVPYAQPSRALRLFSSFVRGRRLPNTTHPSIED